MASGQNVAISGATIGYYLFKRCEANKRNVGTPGEEGDETPAPAEAASALAVAS